MIHAPNKAPTAVPDMATAMQEIAKELRSTNSRTLASIVMASMMTGSCPHCQEACAYYLWVGNCGEPKRKSRHSDGEGEGGELWPVVAHSPDPRALNSRSVGHRATGDGHICDRE